MNAGRLVVVFRTIIGVSEGRLCPPPFGRTDALGSLAAAVGQQILLYLVGYIAEGAICQLPSAKQDAHSKESHGSAGKVKYRFGSD